MGGTRYQKRRKGRSMKKGDTTAKVLWSSGVNMKKEDVSHCVTETQG
jgi:hypothetical protein